MFGHQQKRESHGTVHELIGGTFKLALVAGAVTLLYPPLRRWAAIALHERVERMLSRALGATVRFARLHFSPSDGSFELQNLSLSRTPSAEPFLRVARVRGLVRLRNLLGGELLLDAVELDRPVASVIRRSHGSVTNLPPALEVSPLQLAHDAEHALEAAETGARTAHKLGLKMRLKRATLIDGEFRFRDDSLDGYEVAADGIIGQFFPASDGKAGYEFDGVVANLARRDHPVDLGDVCLRGRLTNVRDLTRFPDAGLQTDLTADGPQQLHAHIECPSIASRRMRMQFDAETDLASLAPLIPEAVPALQPLRNSGTHGHVHADGTITYDPQHGLQMPTFNQSAQDVAIGGTAQT